MGQPKQLLEFQGETLIQKGIKTALATLCHPIIIVLGAYYNEIKSEIEKPGNDEIIIIKNQDWQHGMSTSVKVGLETLLTTNPSIDAALFLLTDQPLLPSAHLLELIHHYEEQKTGIVASFYNDRPGVPALFDKKWFPALLQLVGDQGARKLLELYKDEVYTIPFPEGAFDMDTPENYKYLKQHFE